MNLARFLWLSPFLSFILGYFLISFVSGNTLIQTPSLIGLPLDKAALMLSQKNLNLRIVGHKDESDLAEGTIVSQTPAANSPIKERQSLYLVLARKPAPLQTPDLHNATAQDARASIEAQSLQPKIVTIPADTHSTQCCAQYPCPGTASTDQTVIAYFSQNQKPVLMPNFKKRSLDKIASFLSIQGITAEVLHMQATPPHHQCSNCVVTDQRPLAGSLIVHTVDKPLTIQLQVAAQQ